MGTEKMLAMGAITPEERPITEKQVERKEFPRPHGEKLQATLANDKLPKADVPRVEQAIERYKAWLAAMDAANGDTPEQYIEKLVGHLNSYKLTIDVDLIFDSDDDFLYRQAGQLKLNNSVIEEFLPRLFSPKVVPELTKYDLTLGPTKAYSALYFESSLASMQDGGGLRVRTKDQDFAISRPLYIRASHSQDFAASEQATTYVAYVAAECKTNLDKTMFQEACATAHDVKSAVPGAKYFLLCEWLDMTPLSTAPTDIDEVILLRKAKRVNSNVRKNYSTAQDRRRLRDEYVNYLKTHPFNVEMFQRFVNHVSELLRNELLVENDVLSSGYF